MKKSIAAFSLLLIFSACAEKNDYDPNWGSGDLPLGDGKADVIDLAPPITFDKKVEGSVDETELDLYKISLTRGDKITLRKDVTKGDLRPDVSLFTRSGSSIRSDDFDVTSKRLTKNYTIGSSGEFLVVVRAFRNEGAGSYEVLATCDGGPCAGEFPEPDPDDEFELFEAIDCIDAARICALNELPRFNGAVGEKRSESIFNDCIEKTGTSLGTSCAPACDFSDDAADLCFDIKRSLPFYADQPAECTARVNECMDDCMDFGDFDGDDFFSTTLGLCWSFGFNGNCDSLARSMPECGGDVTNETAVCYEECLVMPGAFMDDMDVICEEECGECGIECLRQRFGFDEVTQRDSGLQGDPVNSFEGDVSGFGDICITYIQVRAEGDGELPVGLYGVIEPDQFRCLGDRAEGGGIAIEMSALEEVVDNGELDTLNNLDLADRFFRWDGTGLDFDMF